MKTAIKIAAAMAVIGAIAVIAIAGSALAYGGNTNAGYSQGMIGQSNGMGMMSDQGHGCMHGQYTSGTTQTNNQGSQGFACPMYANGATAQGVSSTQAANTHCCGCW